MKLRQTTAEPVELDQTGGRRRAAERQTGPGRAVCGNRAVVRFRKPGWTSRCRLHDRHRDDQRRRKFIREGRDDGVVKPDDVLVGILVELGSFMMRVREPMRSAVAVDGRRPIVIVVLTVHMSRGKPAAQRQKGREEHAGDAAMKSAQGRNYVRVREVGQIHREKTRPIAASTELAVPHL
jgi:hypothetical protein